MPKPLKKAPPKPKPPAKPKRPSDPNRAAHAMIAEHMARLDAESAPESAAPLDFKTAYKAHMAKLGAAGGKIGGKRRMETMTSERRSEIALKAARTRWANAAKKR